MWCLDSGECCENRDKMVWGSERDGYTYVMIIEDEVCTDQCFENYLETT